MTRRAGAVLVGGASRRMGRDKATLLLGDGTVLGRRAVEALLRCEAIEGDVAVVGGDRRVADTLGPLGTRWVADPTPPLGPVGGVHAALADAASRGFDSVVILPCDLPRVTTQDVETLIAASRSWASSVVVASVDGRTGYPIGVWPVAVASTMAAALGGGPVDFATALAASPAMTVPMPDAFRDADEPRDLPDGGLV